MYEELGQTEKRVVGFKQVLRALEKDMVQTVYVARDADDFLYRRIVAAAEEKRVALKKVDTMKELGQFCRVDVKAAAAGLLK